MSEKRTITNKAIRYVLAEYWLQYRHKPWISFFAFLLPAVGSIFVFFVPPLIFSHIVNILTTQKNITLIELAPHIALLGGLWFFGEMLWRIGMHLDIILEAEGIRQLCNQSFKLLMNRDYDFYSNNFAGSITKKFFAFTRGFENFTDALIFNVFSQLIPMIFAFGILYRYSPYIPFILVCWLLFLMYIGFPIMKKRLLLVEERHEAGSKNVGRLSDVITNIITIKSFAKETQEQEYFKGIIANFIHKFTTAAHFQNQKFDMVVSPIYVLANASGLVAAIYFTKQLLLPVGTTIVVFSYYSQVTRIFWELQRMYRNIESTISEAGEFTQLILDPPAVVDIPHPKKLHVTTGTIQFKEVFFSYSEKVEAKKPFLHNFNLEILGNQKVGLVGISGGGKTTITRLISRFSDIQAGKILIDGQDIALVSQKSLREAIAYVPQEPLLFHRSIYENISYGDEKASKQDVYRAAKIAHADEFIRELPKKYETLVGERGIKLSGGQRQRVAIARAVLKKSHILILDEATSALDSESEKYIQDGLKYLMQNKTALVIAHRLSTIKHLDRILVLDKGKIVQDGTHDELIHTQGIYSTLWNHQTGEFLEI